MSRNFWSQALLGSRDEKLTLSKNNKNYLIFFMCLGLFVAGILVLLPYVAEYRLIDLSIVDLRFLQEMDNEFFLFCIIFNFASFIIVSLNRHQKNLFTMKNRLFDLAKPSALLALCYCFIILILWALEAHFLLALLAKVIFLIVTYKIYRIILSKKEKRLLR